VPPTDRSKLSALLDSQKLTPDEERAFRDMMDQLEAGGVARLSTKQREWVDRVYHKLQLDAEEGSANLFSSGKVKKTGKETVYPWETGPKPLKPPGRS
jgi:hypothetical protein